MLLRGQQVSGVRLLVDIICCLCGVCILIYAVSVWSTYGFSLGPDHRLHPGAPDPSGHAPWLLLVGLAISAYFGFSLASTFVHTEPDNEPDETENI
jgi:hypothetical protein